MLIPKTARRRSMRCVVPELRSWETRRRQPERGSSPTRKGGRLFILRSTPSLTVGLLPRAHRSLLSPAAVLTIFLRFFRTALANLSLSLERDQAASVLRHFVSIGTVIRAPIACL